MIRIYFILYSLLCTSVAFAWTVNADFETGALGNKAQGNDAFSEAFRYSTYTSKITHSGKQAAQLKIDQGTNGWGNWGGRFNYPSKLYEGDEVWFRIFLYLPDGFNFKASGQGIKAQRIHTASPSGANEGYIGTLLGQGGINVGSEVDPDFYNVYTTYETRSHLGPNLPTGKWITLEQYVKFSSTRGTYRVWRDGELIFEDINAKTLRTSKSISDYIYLFTYWNGDAPATQHAYLDDVIITNQKPSNVDRNGNPYIGAGSFENIAPPNPPSMK
jgi:hypothetical protein